MNSLTLALLRVTWGVVSGYLQVEVESDDVVELAWGGCRAEVRGPRCITGIGDELVVWTRLRGSTPAGSARCGEGSAFELAGDGYTRLSAGFDDGGCWTRVKVERPSGALEVRDRDDTLLWSLPFMEDPPRSPELSQVDNLFAAGEDAATSDLLQSLLSRRRIGPPDLELARVLDLAGKVAIRSDEFSVGVRYAEEARDVYESLGWTSSACNVTYALVRHHWVLRRDRDAALSALHRAARCPLESPRYAVHHRHAHAMLVEGQGDAYDTWLAYLGVDELARRIQDHDFESAILATQHVIADQLHRPADIRRIERRMEELTAALSATASCGLNNALSTWGWSVLMRRERGLSAADPLPTLVTVRERYGRGRCRDADDLRNATINLALAELQRGEPARAELLLVDVGATPEDPEAELWRHLILARAAISRRNFKQAGRSSGELDELALRHADPYFGWYAASVRGEMYAAQGQHGLAIRAYEDAEILRDEMALPLSLGAGRERATAPWHRSTQRLIALQLDQQRPVDAMRTVRLARRRGLEASRELAALDDRDRRRLADEFRRRRDEIDSSARLDGSRTGDGLTKAFDERRRQRMALRRMLDGVAGTSRSTVKLPEPNGDELLLVYHEAEEGWVGFAARGEHIVTAVIPPLPAMSEERASEEEKLGSALYGPFTDVISEAKRIRIIAEGPLMTLDLHALPYRGRPLFAHSPVYYSLDLTEEERLEPSAFTRGLLVAANPGGSAQHLDFVEREAAEVVSHMERLGVGAARLVGAEATRAEVLDELPGSDAFHFVGHHVELPEAAGSLDAWDHVLLLEGGTTLGVEDILTARASHMPRFVFLSACSASRADPVALSGGVAIGHSFLLRGAEMVVAPSRPVNDAAAARFAEAFYRRIGDPAALTDPSILADTQRELLGSSTCDELPDVCMYRALMP